MAPPAADGSVIRRSVYQNSNTLVEVLIKSKEPRPRSCGAARPTAASEPAWPAAVPVRKDGRPLSASSQQLPVRPRTGRQLPAWRPVADQETRGSSPERTAGRGGRPGGGRDGGQRVAPARVPAARHPPPPPPPPQGVLLGRPASGRGEREVESNSSERFTSDAFKTWTVQLNKIVQDIRKRPATAHLRPLLARLEETVRVPPVPPAVQQQPHDDDPLRLRLEEIQQENEQLQRKFQTLSAAMREYQQQRLAGGGDQVDGAAEAELAEVKRQLAKYKKYAKELKKTKENLLNTIQTLEESHTMELKELKEEHETQVAQVLAQFTSETELLASFRADAEAVQRSLALRVRENTELQRAVTERDAEIERLAALNQSLHDLALKQLQQLASSELPSLSQLMTKLQCPGPDGAGDGVPRPAWLSAATAGRDVSLLSLDVTEPLPARPFPREWADLSLASLVGSTSAAPVSDGGGQRVPGDGDRDRRPPSGGAADPPAAATGSSGGGQRQRATDDRPDGRAQQRPSSDGGTYQRLFGGGGDQRAVSAGAGDQRAVSGVIRDQQPVSGGQGDQRPSSGTGVSDRCGPVSCGAADCQRPPPVGSQTSEEGFQRSLARLNERLTDLQQGVSRAAQVLSP